MSTRLVVVLVAFALLGLVVGGCPPKGPASQKGSPPIADPAKAAGQETASRQAAANAETPEAANAESPEAANAAAEEPGDEVAKLFETKCSKCHPLAPVEERTYTPDEALKLVKEMQAKDTKWISDEEADKIAKHIAEKYPKG